MLVALTVKSNVDVHVLNTNDYDLLEDFLQPYLETSMFMRSNAKRVGLKFKDEPYHAYYVGLFINDKLQGLLVLNWNGIVFAQADNPQHLEALLAYTANHFASFLIMGILAPVQQAQYIQDFICPQPQDIAKAVVEEVYTLDLLDLILPASLHNGSWRCRLAQLSDVDMLMLWRLAYEQEALNLIHDDSSPDKTKINLLNHIKDQTLFVLEVDQRLVSMATFNATLADSVQIGSVWTPIQFRRHGYARAVVAGALRQSSEQGVGRGILFTSNPYAVNCYKALGFVYSCDYKMVLLKNGCNFKYSAIVLN